MFQEIFMSKVEIPEAFNDEIKREMRCTDSVNLVADGWQKRLVD